MRVFYDLENLPQFEKPVLTIGTFDGVHQGHRVILDRIIQKAKSIGGETVLLTFDPHPRMVIGQGKQIELIQTLDEKIQTLSAIGIDNVVVVPFTLAFAAQSAEEYIRDFLVNHFHPHTIIIGYDHQFGKGRLGDYHLLESQKHIYNYQLEEISVQELKDSAISSTRIRQALQQGDVKTAAAFLGQAFTFSGLVVDGDKRGRTIGFPTANIVVQDPYKLIPATGVYAVQVKHASHTYGGMMNIGYRPTIDSDKVLKIEVHIFDFDADLYGQTIEIACIDKIRDEQKFDGLEKLIQQLHADKETATMMLDQ